MNIRVVDYDHQWSVKFAEESARIRNILGDVLIDIHHIGSTSVVGLKAKPIIDIIPVVRNIEEVDRFNAQFIDLGYEVMGEFGIACRRYFRKGGDDRTHQLHVFQQDDKHNITRHIAVRDYLCQHPDVVKQYSDLKSKLALLYPNDIDGYCDGKDDFMQELETKALAWYAQQKR